jgi:hypothetical protein
MGRSRGDLADHLDMPQRSPRSEDAEATVTPIREAPPATPPPAPPAESGGTSRTRSGGGGASRQRSSRRTHEADKLELAGVERVQMLTRAPKPLVAKAERAIHLLKADGVDVNKQDLAAALMLDALGADGQPDLKRLEKIVRAYREAVEPGA